MSVKCKPAYYLLCDVCEVNALATFYDLPCREVDLEFVDSFLI